MHSPGQLIDLSHTIENGLITYKGLPAPVICDYLSREASKEKYEDATFHIGRIDMVANTGTYIDCPFHRYEDGKDFTQLELERFANLEATCLSIPHTERLAITADVLKTFPIVHAAVLIHTGWDEFWNTDKYYENNPHLTADAAEYLISLNVTLVGIDSLNIDNTMSTKKRPVHSLLLGKEILIVEHLCNLGALPQTGFQFSALPPKVKGMGSFPVRAFGKIG
jgi:arylformamidase